MLKEKKKWPNLQSKMIWKTYMKEKDEQNDSDAKLREYGPGETSLRYDSKTKLAKKHRSHDTLASRYYIPPKLFFVTQKLM